MKPVVVVMVLSKFSQRRGIGDGELLAVRQSLRLSGKHTVHVVQFEDRTDQPLSGPDHHLARRVNVCRGQRPPLQHVSGRQDAVL